MPLALGAGSRAPPHWNRTRRRRWSAFSQLSNGSPQVAQAMVSLLYFHSLALLAFPFAPATSALCCLMFVANFKVPFVTVVVAFMLLPLLLLFLLILL